MNRFRLSRQTSQVWSFPSPFTGKWTPTSSNRNGVYCRFLPGFFGFALQLPTSCMMRSSRKARKSYFLLPGCSCSKKESMKNICIICWNGNKLQYYPRITGNSHTDGLAPANSPTPTNELAHVWKSLEITKDDSWVISVKHCMFWWVYNLLDTCY